jgi:hypothetical protein
MGEVGGKITLEITSHLKLIISFSPVAGLLLCHGESEPDFACVATNNYFESLCRYECLQGIAFGGGRANLFTHPSFLKQC